MTAWLPWVFFTSFSLALYHVAIKLMSSQLPMPLYLMIMGTTMALSGAVMGYIFKLTGDITLTASSLKAGLITALAVICVEIGAYYTYKSGAILSLTPPISAAITTTTVLVIGLAFFHERLTMQQLLGVVFMLAGIVLVTLKVPANV